MFQHYLTELQRIKFAYTFRELEDLTGFSHATIWRMLNNTSRVRMDFICKLHEVGLIELYKENKGGISQHYTGRACTNCLGKLDKENKK